MDPSSFKDRLVSRGLTYHYYYSPLAAGKPTLLFLHGFPSSSFDWNRQIAYFQPKGYGILAPDLLGYGKTSKPTEPAVFRMNNMAADIVDILDAEHLGEVIGIAHDWGCVLLSRLSMLHHQRFSGFVWLGLSFMAPYTEKFDLQNTMKAIKAAFGYEGFSYWEFLQRPDAPEIIANNIESFIQLIYPKDPLDWLTYIVLPGKTEEWVRKNLQPGRPEYLTDFEFEKVCQNFLESGIRSPLNWYMSQLENVDLEDNQQIDVEDWKLKRPSLFAAALKDCISTPQMGKAAMDRFGVQVTTTEFNTGHWVHLENSEEVNKAIETWIGSLTLTA